MRNFLIFVFIFNIYNCTSFQDNNKQGLIEESHEDTVLKEIKFSEIGGEAVLIGKKIDLLDVNLKFIKDISNLSGKIVRVNKVSDSLFNKEIESNDFCNSFWYVEIQYDTIKGIVNGRKVFKILDLQPNESYKINDNKIQFLRTEFYGMGVDYQGDLIGCSIKQPVVLKDSANNYYGLVYLVDNEYSNNVSWENSYSFFELKSDDGVFNSIDSVTVEGAEIKLKIHNEFQEGENYSNVLLRFENGKYNAEYLN